MRTLFLVFSLSAAAAADELVLTSGTVVEGKVEDLGDSYRVTRRGGSAVYPKSMVLTRVSKKTDEEVYEERAAAIRAGDAEGHLALARWCLLQKLGKEAVAQFEKVVALRPDHEEARAGAGYRKHDGQWMTEAQINEARGLILHKGRWMTPEQRDLDQALEQQKSLDAAIVKEVSSLMARLRSSDAKKREEAAEGLGRIDDRYKAKAFLEAIPSPSKEVRAFVFAELGRMKEPAAARPLARRSLWDEEENLRLEAFRALLAIAHPDTAIFFLPFLGEESISARIRAVDSIAKFKDLRAVPPLIAALENNHELEKSYDAHGREMTAASTRTIILSDGRTITLPRLVKIKADPIDKDARARLHSERASLAAALAAITGESLGEDPGPWRAWVEKKRTP